MRSVKTTFQVLEAVASRQPVGLSELARSLELPKTTVQRSLSTLSELGWIVSSDTDRARWELSDRIHALGEQVGVDARLRQAALPALRTLHAETLETIHLTVTDGTAMRLIERVDSVHPLRLVQPIGSRSPLHASSNGKAVLANLPHQEIEAHLEAELPPLARNTITDRARLRAELKTIRQRGFAVADQELIDGITSIAACIRSRGGRPVAAMSISGPSTRVVAALHEDYGTRVAKAASAVSRQLGG